MGSWLARRNLLGHASKIHPKGFPTRVAISMRACLLNCYPHNVVRASQKIPHMAYEPWLTCGWRPKALKVRGGIIATTCLEGHDNVPKRMVPQNFVFDLDGLCLSSCSWLGADGATGVARCGMILAGWPGPWACRNPLQVPIFFFILTPNLSKF